MIITLLDGNKDYAEMERKEYRNSTTVYCQTGFPSLKTCVSRYLICKDGRVYGRIATELVPSGVHNGLEYEIKDDEHLGKMLQYYINKIQSGL